MGWYRETLQLSEGTFTILRDLIHERTGLYYDAGRRELIADKLSPRVLECGFGAFLDYYYFLKYDKAAADEWQHVMDVLSVNETYFWREADQLRAVADVLVPRYAMLNRTEPLRIWSAACATGEEPLSLALALNEVGWFERLPIQLRASDASPAAIAKARSGVYRERSFRSLPPTLRAKYFTPTPGGWCISRQIHARVEWSVANLMAEEEIAGLAAADIVFCRNAFIYFSDQTMRQVVSHLWKRMRTPGYLFVGAAESLVRVTTGFALQEIGDAFVYVKAGTD